jgi:hypothetical protein
MAIGIIGTLILEASEKAPILNGSNVGARDVVPSGYTRTETPFRKRCSMVCSVALRLDLSERLTKIAPANFEAAPIIGHFDTSDFATTTLFVMLSATIGSI